uniref:zinc finger BED domain-containing protein 1-like n=1 Tax=Ciona intestinalis TaxID=7719 RepID=UPI0005212532
EEEEKKRQKERRLNEVNKRRSLEGLQKDALQRQKEFEQKWFSKSESDVSCKLCSKGFSLRCSTTTLKYHLQSSHKDKLAGASGPSSSGSSESDVLVQSDIRQYQVRPKLSDDESRRIDVLVSSFMWRDMRPFHIVEGQGFRDLVHGLNHQYKIKHRSTYQAITERTYKSAKSFLLDVLQHANYMGITTDMWTSIRNDSYITVTVHWITDDWKMQHGVLTTECMTEANTAENLSLRLTDVLAEYRITSNKISATVTDNGRNIKKAVDLLDDWTQLSCFAHTLQLCVKAGLDIPAVSRMRAGARRLVNHFKHSSKATAALREKQFSLRPGETVLDLITECPARWNSTFDMFDRLLLLQWCIRAVLTDFKITKPSVASSLQMSSTQWDLCQSLVHVLKPLKIATTMMSASKYPSIPWIYPVLFTLQKKLESCDIDSGATAHCKTAIREQIDKRFFASNWHRNLPVLASVLDPRYKFLKFIDNDATRQEVYDHLKGQITEFAAKYSDFEQHLQSESTNEAHTFDPFEELCGKDTKKQTVVAPEDEIKAYLREPAQPSDSDPLQWWKLNAARLPTMSLMARFYFCSWLRKRKNSSPEVLTIEIDNAIAVRGVLDQSHSVAYREATINERGRAFRP